MGFCIKGDDQYDAFLSYAHADDEAHNGWVGDFEQYLIKKTIAALQRTEEIDASDAQMFKVCRDKTGFPESGPLDEIIDEKVRQAQFLFIFLGKGYLKSEYCLKELEIFRENVGGTVEEALKRLYFIVLDRDALGRLREGQPDRLPDDRRQLWHKLRDLTQMGIRKEDFIRGNALLPVRRGDCADPDFHALCTPVIEELARKVIARRSLFQPQPSPPPPRATVVVGAVPERLKTARAALVDALDGSPVAAIEEAELRQPTDDVRARLELAQVLVQPFDDLAVLFRRGDPSGGHLAVQKALFEECHGGETGASGASIIWWEPPPRGLAEGPRGGPIEEFDKPFLDSLPDDQKRRCSAQVLAAELLQQGLRPNIIARVVVEYSEDDRKHLQRAKQIVEARFHQLCEQKKAELQLDCTVKIDFPKADWWALQQELQLAEKPDEVVIVYNPQNKGYPAFREQTQLLSSLEAVYHRQVFPAIFLMGEKGYLEPSDEWSVVKFTVTNDDIRCNEDDLDDFVNRLIETIYHRHFQNHENRADEIGGD